MPKTSKRDSLQVYRAQVDLVPRAAIRLALFAVVAGTLWAHLTDLPEIAYAPGRLEPVSALRRIEHPDGGIVARLPAAEGDFLRAGDVILELSPDDIDVELQSLVARPVALRRMIDRARTVLRQIGPDPLVAVQRDDPDPVVRARLETYETRRARLAEQLAVRSEAITATRNRADNLALQQDIARDDYDRATNLHRLGRLTTNQLNDAQRNLLDATVAAIEAREALAAARAQEADALIALLEFHAQTRETLQSEAAEAEDNFTVVSEALAEARLRRARLTVTMPLDGVIQTLHLRTLGEVLDAGGLVAEVLPAGEDLVAVVDLHPLDVGHVNVGQRVDLRLTSFDLKRYGTLGGVVERISPTSYEDENGDFSFRLRLRLDRQEIGDAANPVPLRPGIEVNAAIVTGSRSLLDYALSPIATPLREAFFER